MADADFVYQCIDSIDVACAETCVSLETCQACDCAVVLVDGAAGPWGNFMDVFFCLLPIIFLIWATLKQQPLPTTTSLPTAAFFMYLVRLMYLKSDPLLTNAAVILGFHEALTPLSIMAGAITLFETMEATYCLPYMMREIKVLTAGHPIAELML
jgi:L-lactate permease